MEKLAEERLELIAAVPVGSTGFFTPWRSSESTKSVSIFSKVVGVTLSAMPPGICKWFVFTPKGIAGKSSTRAPRS